MAAALFFAFLLLSCTSLFIYTLRLGISPMPSSTKAKRAIIELLPPQPAGATIYELGSGWGGLARLLAKHHPNAQVIAIELSPIPFLFSKIQQLLFPKPNLIILRKNFDTHDLSDAHAIICYLFPGAMKKLTPKLSKQTILISNTFSLPNRQHETLLILDDLAATRIYRYSPPL